MNINPTTGMPELDEKERERRTALVKGLRDFADWYERRENLPPAYFTDVIMWARSREELAPLLRAAGNLEKDGRSDDDTMRFRRRFGPVEFRIVVDKADTCERVVTGSTVIPAKPERTQVLPAEPEKTVETFEWRCPESVLALADKKQSWREEMDEANKE